jgi:single-stranded-DNA-specific exonuclease
MAQLSKALMPQLQDQSQNLLPTKHWKLLPAAPPALIASVSEHPLLVQVLYNRGLASAGEIHAFLTQSDIVRANPNRLRDMDVAVTRILQAIARQEVICVYGDFDADGVTSTALMVTALQAAGGRVGPYIPDRVDEGYGLNVDAITRIAQQAQLIVTVDCGMRSTAEVEHANALGVDVIITDHHTVGAHLPPALAVINPRRSDCPSRFESLAGVGVAFRLAQAVLRAVAADPASVLSADRAVAIEEELLDLVAIGTVADMMPLLGENRELVRRGLVRLSQSPRPGIAALMGLAGMGRGGVDATMIGFRLGPRINAAGRISSAMIAYKLLRTNDPAEARALAGQLEALNHERQALVVNAQIEAEAQIAAQGADAPLLIVRSTQIRSGIVGLVAGRLTDRYYRPAVVIEEGPDESRGSARSIREFDISRALDEVAGLLVRHGGHNRAAGFTVRTQNLPAFTEALGNVAARELAAHATLRPTLDVDLALPAADINWGLQEQFARLEPTGQDNPAPMLLARRMRVRETRTVGGGKHLKLILDSRPHQPVFDGMAFQQGRRAPYLTEGMEIDAVFTLEVNDFNGRRTLQWNIRDFGASGGALGADPATPAGSAVG